jgi:hypothetical protein
MWLLSGIMVEWDGEFQKLVEVRWEAKFIIS